MCPRAEQAERPTHCHMYTYVGVLKLCARLCTNTRTYVQIPCHAIYSASAALQSLERPGARWPTQSDTPRAEHDYLRMRLANSKPLRPLRVGIPSREPPSLHDDGAEVDEARGGPPRPFVSKPQKRSPVLPCRTDDGQQGTLRWQERGDRGDCQRCAGHDAVFSQRELRDWPMTPPNQSRSAQGQSNCPCSDWVVIARPGTLKRLRIYIRLTAKMAIRIG